MKRKYWMIIIIAALLMAGSVGLNINTIGVFLNPVSQGLNLSLGDVSVHSTFLSIGLAFSAFLVAPALKRFSFKFLIICATALMAITTFLMSKVEFSWQLNVLGLIRGFASAFYGIIPLQLLINNWFVERHGLVTSIVFSFSGVAGAVFSPIMSSIVQSAGWERAYVVKALVFILLSLPAIIYPFKFRPEEEGYLAYGALKNANKAQEVSSRLKEETGPVNKEPVNVNKTAFILILLASIFTTSLVGLFQHLSSLGQSKGFTAQSGAFMVSACMLGNIIFKLIIGIISDAKNEIFACLSMLLVTITGLVILYISQAETLSIPASFLFGASFAMTAVGLSITTKRIFGNAAFAKVFPSINFIANIGAAFAVSFYGFSYDFFKSYNFANLLSIVFCLLVGLSIIWADKISLNKKEKTI